MREIHWVLGLVSASLVAVGCGGTTGDVVPITPVASAELDSALSRLVDDHGLSSLAFGVLRGGGLIYAGAAGTADARTSVAARSDTIYSIASCSKPLVGLAVARLMELHPEFDLDGDINTWLGWPRAVRHPDYPDTPITMRQLLLHTSGIAVDGPADYDTYPKPDPDQALDAFLRGLFGTADAYLDDQQPGTAEEYSNLGVAMAALVVEKVSGKEFKVFCNDELFTPLGMNDTRWTYGEFSAAQKARVARPHDEQGEPYEIYGFNDYPSGLLRTTLGDIGKLMGALIANGATANGRFLSETSVNQFQSVPMLIAQGRHMGRDGFTHDGSESGVNAFYFYSEDGAGLVFFINSDVDEPALKAIQSALETLAQRRIAAP